MGKFLDEPQQRRFERPSGINDLRLKTIGASGPTFSDPAFQAESQTLAQEAKEGSKSTRTRRKAKALLEQSLTLFGQMAKDTKDRTGLNPGRLAGIVNVVTGALGINPFVKPFEGDKVETATGVAKIAAPSAKVGPDLINMFGQTLPGKFTTMSEAKNQIVNTISNGIFEELSASGEQVDVNAIRAEVSEEVDDFIASREDIFGGLGSTNIPQSRRSGRFIIEEE